MRQVWQMTIHGERKNMFVVASSIGEAVGYFRRGWREDRVDGGEPVTPNVVDAVAINILDIVSDKGEFSINFDGSM